MEDFFMFQYCPRCSYESPDFLRGRKVSCPSCGFQFYQNTAAAVAVLLEYKEHFVIMKRGREPGKGLLDLPGGFVDPDESAEDACRREIREEIGVEISDLTYRSSCGNTYPYKGITYKTCDMLFTARCESSSFTPQEDEIQEILFIEKDKLSLENFAFDSLKKMVRDFLSLS